MALGHCQATERVIEVLLPPVLELEKCPLRHETLGIAQLTPADPKQVCSYRSHLAPRPSHLATLFLQTVWHKVVWPPKCTLSFKGKDWRLLRSFLSTSRPAAPLLQCQ